MSKTCNCISEFEAKMIGREHKGKKVIKAEITSAAIMFSSFSRQMTGEMEFTMEGGKRPMKQNLVYSYCPFCGTKYPETKD